MAPALFVRTDAAGRESWYGQWRSGDVLVKRKLGAIHISVPRWSVRGS
jgi:hypothetical protein